MNSPGDMEGANDALFERLARGEAGAMEEVCRRYGERVMRIARRRLRDELRGRLETADLAQEAMVAVIRRAPRYRFESEGAFLGWVNRLVEETIIDAARRFRAARRSSRKEVPLDQALEAADPRGERPSQIFERGETSDRILMALAGLRPSDRQVVTSRLFLKLGWKDVALAMGTTREAAQMRYRRARQRLASVLLKRGGVRTDPAGRIRSRGTAGRFLALWIAVSTAVLPGCGWVPALVGTLVAKSGGGSKEKPPAAPRPETLRRGAGPYQVLKNEPVGLGAGRFLPEENGDFLPLGAAVIYRDERLVTFFRGDGTGRLIEGESVLVNGESAVALAAVPAPRGSPWGLLVATKNTLEWIRWDQGLKVSLVALEGVEDPGRRLTVGDLDGDGSPDAAVSSFGNGWVEVFRVPWAGEPFRSLGPPLRLPGPPSDLSAGDFFPDPERRSDLAVLVEEGNTNSILLYVARSGEVGIFCDAPDATTGPLTDQTFSLSKAADLALDPDGNLSGQVPEIPQDPPAPVRFDLNGDGTTDLAYTRDDGTGTILFSRVPCDAQTTPDLSCLAACGTSPFPPSCPTPCGWKWNLSMQNRGGGHFSPAATGLVLLRLPDPDPTFKARAAYGRATSDAMLEAVVASYFTPNGKDFEKMVSYPLPGGGLGLASGDLNGDGWTDLIATAGKEGTYSLVTFLANPPGDDPADDGVRAAPFHVPFASTAGETPRTVSSPMDCAFGHAAADAAEPFLAAVDNANREVVVEYLEMADGLLWVIREERYPDLGGRPWSLVIRDFDGDGDDDIVVSAYDRIHLLRNRGRSQGPRFAAEEYRFGDLIRRDPGVAEEIRLDPSYLEKNFAAVKINQNVSAGPLDGTFAADLVIPFTSKASGLLVIRNGLPSGDVRFYPMKISPSQVAIANLDDDGALDLLVILNDPANLVQFFLGDPADPGTFIDEDPDPRSVPPGLQPIQDSRRRSGFQWVETDNAPLARGTSSEGWPRARWVIGINDYYAVAYFNSPSAEERFNFESPEKPPKVIYSGEDPESVMVYDLFGTGDMANDIAIVDENRDAVVLLRGTDTPGVWFQESTLLTAGLPQRIVPFEIEAHCFLALDSRSQQEIVVYQRDCSVAPCTYQNVGTLPLRRPDLTGPRTGMALAPCPGGGYVAALAGEDEEDIRRAKGEFFLDLLEFPGSGVDLAGIGSLGASGMNRLMITDPKSQDPLHRGVLLTDVDRNGRLDLLTFDPGSREVYLRPGIEGEPPRLEVALDESDGPLIDWNVAAVEGDSTWIAITTEKRAFLLSIDTHLDATLEWKSRKTYGRILQGACGWRGRGKDPRADLFFAVLEEDGISVEAPAAGEPAIDPILRIEGSSKIGRIGVRDLDGDGLDDLAVVDGLAMRVYLASGKKGHLFSGKPRCVVSLPRFTDPVDLVFLKANGDGWIDIGYGARDGAVFVFLGNGRGAFGDPAELHAAPDLEALRAADLDGDGIDEILAAVGAPGLIILPGR